MWGSPDRGGVDTERSAETGNRAAVVIFRGGAQGIWSYTTADIVYNLIRGNIVMIFRWRGNLFHRERGGIQGCGVEVGWNKSRTFT